MNKRVPIIGVVLAWYLGSALPAPGQDQPEDEARPLRVTPEIRATLTRPLLPYRLKVGATLRQVPRLGILGMTDERWVVAVGTAPGRGQAAAEAALEAALARAVDDACSAFIQLQAAKPGYQDVLHQTFERASEYVKRYEVLHQGEYDSTTYCVVRALVGTRKFEQRWCTETLALTFEMPDGAIPEFPWPPPEPSGSREIPSEFFKSSSPTGVALCDVDTALRNALDACGYYEKSYYAVPGGFALVTHLEQINEDGTCMSERQRWAIDMEPVREFSLAECLKAIFTSDPGYFRIIAFIAAPPFTQDGQPVSREDAMKWLNAGLNKLPEAIGQIQFTGDYACKALIYEFEQLDPTEPAITRLPGRLTGMAHLQKAQIWPHLERP